MNIKIKLSLITLCLSVTLTASVNAKDVTIYYTNDLHAHVSPGKIPAVDKERAVGGFANIATIVNDAKKKNKDVFFFDAGDYFTGPYISTLTKGEAIIDIMNTMPFDAVSVGNHEFDHGVDNMVKQLSKANFPILLGNVFYTNSDRPVWNNPWTIVEKNGIKIGVIGVHQKFAFYDTIAAKAYAGSEARDEVPYIQKGLDALKGKVDITVLLIHEGTPARQSSYGNKDVARMLQADIDTAKKFKGIDVLITGHAHVGTPEPIKINDTLIVSTDAYGTDIGKLVLDFNPKTKKIDGYDGKLITVFEDEYKPDPRVQAKIEQWNTKLKSITDQVIGSTTAPFTRAYGESSPMGNLLIDTMMDKAPSAVVGLQNSGGLRADFPQGNLKYGDVITTFPFINELVEMDLTGKELTNLMIHATNLTNGVLQVSKNVHVEYDSKKPLGERIIKFTINNHPVDPAKTYRVATDSFCATGGDGFEAFLKGTNIKTISSTTTAESIIDYVKAHSPLKPDLELRVSDVSAAK